MSLCLWVAFSSASAQENETKPAPSFRFASGQSALKIPFELYNNLIFIRARVNESEPLWFLLDAGADESVIRRSRAQFIGLEFLKSGETGASGGSVAVSNLKDVTFNLPGAVISIRPS